MDFFKVINDAGSAINRMVQSVEEKLLNAEKTEYDCELQEKLKKLELITEITNQLIEQTEIILEPNPAYRIEGKLMEKVDKKQDRATPLENLATTFESSAKSIREYHSELMEDFIICAKYQTKLGVSSKEFQCEATEAYVNKLKKLLDVDIHKYQNKKDILENLRLDHDSLKIRFKKAFTVSGKEQLEIEYAAAKKAFDEELIETSNFFSDIDKFFNIHRQLLKEFIEIQSTYYKKCHEELEKFQSKIKDRPIADLSIYENEIQHKVENKKDLSLENDDDKCKSNETKCKIPETIETTENLSEISLNEENKTETKTKHTENHKSKEEEEEEK